MISIQHDMMRVKEGYKGTEEEQGQQQKGSEVVFFSRQSQALCYVNGGGAFGHHVSVLNGQLDKVEWELPRKQSR